MWKNQIVTKLETSNSDITQKLKLWETQKLKLWQNLRYDKFSLMEKKKNFKRVF